GEREIENIKSIMYDMGALGASMSGTGSAVFGFFDDPDRAEAAFNALSGQYRECFLTETSGDIIV
ncbi:MAG: hypothetical protein IJG63_05435, partial [Oscillospiraceae bacterium]|nr:hypothetical protein [Oscillospiraceae bacterium]